MSRQKLKIDVGLDTAPAKKDFKDLETNIKNKAQPLKDALMKPDSALLKLSESMRGLKEKSIKTFDGLKERIKSVAKPVLDMGRKVSSHIVGAFKKATIGVAVFLGAMAAVKKALENLTDIQVEEKIAERFAIAKGEVLAFNKALGGALSFRESLKELSKFRMLGLSKEQAQQAAEAVKPLEVLAGISKEAALEILKTGQANEQVLGALSTNAERLGLDFDNMVNQAGNMPNTLDRILFLIKTIQKEANKNKVIIGGVETTSAADRFFAKLKDLKDKNLKQLYEFISKNEPVFDRWAKNIDRVSTVIGILGKGVVWLSGKLTGMFEVAVKAVSDFFGFIGKHTGISNLLEKMGIIASPEALKAEQAKLKKFAEQRNKILGSSKGAKGGKSRVSLASREAFDELKGQNTEARNQLRNFTKFFLNNVSTMGGSLAGIISASKDIPEQIAVLSSMDFGARAILKTIGLTRQQILQLEKQGFLNEKQVKIALLANQISKAGVNDLEEKVLNQKVMTSELIAQVTGNERLAQMAQIQKSIKDKEIDNIKGQVVLQASIEAIERRRQELTKKRDEAIASSDNRKETRLNAQIKSLEIIENRYNKANSLLKEQALRQNFLLKLSKDKLWFETNVIDPLNRQSERIKASLSIEKERLALQNEYNALLFKADEPVKKAKESRQKELELATRIRDLNIEAQKQRVNLFVSEAIADERSTQLAKSKLEQIKEQKTALEGMLGVQKNISEILEKQSSSLGRFIQGFLGAFQSIQGGWITLLSELGSSLGSILNHSLGAIQTFVAESIKGLAGIGEADWKSKLGAGFLDLLAGISAKFGAVFASIGAGYIAIGNIGQGVAALAAAGGLFALAGVLGGLSSIAQDKGGASSGKSTTSASPPPSVVQAPKPENKEREVFVVINSAPFLGDQSEQARKFAKWAKQNRRVLGEVMP